MRPEAPRRRGAEARVVGRVASGGSTAQRDSANPDWTRSVATVTAALNVSAMTAGALGVQGRDCSGLPRVARACCDAKGLGGSRHPLAAAAPLNGSRLRTRWLPSLDKASRRQFSPRYSDDTDGGPELSLSTHPPPHPTLPLVSIGSAASAVGQTRRFDPCGPSRCWKTRPRH